MADVKALYPIGKTQWRKWGNKARTAYNDMRAKGFTHETAVSEANAVQAAINANKRSFLEKIEDAVEDIAEVAETVSTVAETVVPVIGVAKTVVRATKGRKPRKTS